MRLRRCDPEPLAFRRSLRRDSTDAEQRLWRVLRDRRLAGVKFRRQHPVGRYVLDFYCPALRLAIELDGGQHFEPQEIRRDAARTAYLEALGIRVLRFTDRELFGEADGVLETIWDAVQCRP